VIGQAESGRSAVTCDDGDYIELSESNLPSGASTIVLVKDHKKCEVIDVSSSGVASLECEDGEVVTLNQPLKTGQIILIPGKSAKLISTANRLYDRINEFKISATATKDQQLSEELDEYGAQINADFDAAFAEVVANASAEVQDFLQTVTVLDDMITKLAGSFISGDNDFIFDGRDISELAIQLQIFADSYENMVDLMVAEMLAEMPQATRDTTISSIKNQSGAFISDMRTELERAVYFLNQGDLIEAVDVMDGAMAKEELWQQQVLIPAGSSTMAAEAIATVEQELVEYGESFSEQNRADIEQKLQALKTAVSNGESNLQTFIDELYETMDTAWDSSESASDAGGQDGDAETRALEAIAEVDDSIVQYGEWLTDEKREGLEQKREALKTALADGESNLQPLIDDLYQAMETAWD
jgi:polyhydroxyalkanoate synthesis regulator phasin